MVGRVDRLDAGLGLAEGQLAGVDLLALGDDPGDGAQAGGDPGRAGAGEGRQLVLEHRLVELIGLAVHVQIGPRIAGRDQGRAIAGGAGGQGVDEGVLRSADGGGRQVRGRHHVGGIEPSRMGRGEHEGRGQALGPSDLESRLRAAGPRARHSLVQGGARPGVRGLAHAHGAIIPAPARQGNAATRPWDSTRASVRG